MRLMSFYKGSGKYGVGNLLFNFGAMYVFGGVVITSLKLIWVLLTGNFSSIGFVKEAIMIFVPNPDYIYLNFIINPLVGTVFATIKWSNSMKGRGL